MPKTTFFLGDCELKLFRFGPVDEEKPGVILPDGRWIDVSGIVKDYDEAFFSARGLALLKESLSTRAGKCPVIGPSTRIGPCVARPSKIICIGLNYSKHAAESGADIPKEPVVFLKATTSLAGPNDDVVIPRSSVKTDWEVELAVVMAARTTYVSEAEAMQHIAGYCIHNDYSERSFQLERGGQWCKGKGCDTFAPLGPFLATTDEIEDPHTLRLWLSVNGVMRQDSSTSDMIFRIPALVSYLSQFMTLLPGDIISTGTPGGVGFGMKPPVYLKHGDVVELGIDRLGTAKQRAVSFEMRK
jgi:2,4-didehydro-3-deoxy-L-rhamnonate hydrolase